MVNILAWIKKHPWLSWILLGLLGLIAWLAYRGAFGNAAVVAATGGLAYHVDERLRRHREEARLEAERQRLEDEVAHNKILTEQERRRVADDEIAGLGTEVQPGLWDDAERQPPP